jgi:hypothetical protein
MHTHSAGSPVAWGTRAWADKRVLTGRHGSEMLACSMRCNSTPLCMLYSAWSYTDHEGRGVIAVEEDLHERQSCAYTVLADTMLYRAFSCCLGHACMLGQAYPENLSLV